MAQQFFVDNMIVVIEVSKENIAICKGEIDAFGKVSNLLYDWETTTVIYLSKQPLPTSLQN